MIICQHTRGLLSSNDELALDLPFAETKSIAARVGPTPVLTRASTATYFGPNRISVEFTYDGSTYNANLSQDQIVNGRWQWEDGDTEVYFAAPYWLLTYDSNLVATSAPTTSWRPDDADWSGTGATVTTSNTFGIVRAANNEPRFDHDPVTLACRGLLIEEGRTNLSLYSGAIVKNIGWTGNATSSVSGTGPDGNSSYQISESTINNIQSLANTGGTGFIQITPVVSGTTYTGSIFVKKVAGSIDWMQLTFGGAGFGSTQYANFNIGNGTVGNSAGLASGTSPRIENYGNGWYRLSISATATATIATNNVIIGFIQNTNGTTRLPSYAGSTSNQVLAALCQFEAGSFATSFIPTTTSALARSADVCSITGSDFSGFYNPLEGSFATSQIFNAPASSTIGQVVFDVNDTTALNRTRLLRNSTTGTAGYSNTVGGAWNVAIIGSTSITANQISKFSCCMKTNDFAVYLNNASQGTDVIGTMQAAPTTLTIGDVSAGAARAPINGMISSIRYYRKRLPNAKLQALTAP